jgi:hypothetical protein
MELRKAAMTAVFQLWDPMALNRNSMTNRVETTNPTLVNAAA